MEPFLKTILRPQKSKFVKDTQIKRLTQVNGAENSLKEEKDEYK